MSNISYWLLFFLFDHESYHNMVSLKYHKMSKLDLKIAFVQLGQKITWHIVSVKQNIPFRNESINYNINTGTLFLYTGRQGAYFSYNTKSV